LRMLGVVLSTLVLLQLAGCAPGANELENLGGPDEAGFWQGVWHGVISPITFLVSLFTPDVNVFEVHNDGTWYTVGFMLGLCLVSSSAAASGNYARRLKRRVDEGRQIPGRTS
jgi:hypothetical protein